MTNELIFDMLSLMVERYYDDNPVGGNCHIVLDDHNVRDGDLDFCLKQCRENKDYAGVMILVGLGSLTEQQRSDWISQHWGLGE
jgi:hypothetical protein